MKKLNPVSEADLKEAEATFQKILKLAEDLPEGIEYNLSVGLMHQHRGQVSYLVTTACNMLSRMAHNVAEEHPDAMQGLIPILHVCSSLLRMLGEEEVQAVVKHYHGQIPPDLFALIKTNEIMEKIRGAFDGASGSMPEKPEDCDGDCDHCKKKDIDLDGEGGADA